MQSFSLSPRVIALAAAALVAAAMMLIVVRPLVLDRREEASTPPAAQAKTPAATPAKKSKATPARPAVRLAPGLPTGVARALQRRPVVVVSLFSRNGLRDGESAAQARTGAKAAGAGFVQLNVFDERSARQVHRFAGSSTSPAVLVVRRPGTIATRFEGFADSAMVAAAAREAR